MRIENITRNGITVQMWDSFAGGTTVQIDTTEAQPGWVVNVDLNDGRLFAGDPDQVDPIADARRDRDALDKIADILAAPQWSGADMLECIADALGTVRPHPGEERFETRNAYARHFAAVTGRDVIEEDEDEDDYWVEGIEE